MKAIRKVAARPNGLEWAEIPVPPCGPDEVLVKVRAASLCGTDGHIYNWDGTLPEMILAATDGLRRPLTIGHEFCGEVVEVGRRVKGAGEKAAEPIRAGDFVSAEFRLRLASRVGAHTTIRTDPAPDGNPQAHARERERVVGLIRDAASPWEADLVMEMSGHPDAIDTALAAVRRGGKVILFGLPKRSSITVERYAEDVIFGGVTLKGIIGRKIYGTWKTTRELTARPEVRTKIRDIITHTFPLARYQEAFQKMIGRESGKVVLRVAE